MKVHKEVLMSRILSYFSLPIILLVLLVLTSGNVQASGTPARTVTMAAGPYIVDINLYQDPPSTDQPLEVTVVPHDRGLPLSGLIVAQPGLGTDAVPLHTKLTAAGDNTGTLRGSISMPVRGAWQIVIQLDGPRGAGSATVPVVVGAPGAMPEWLAWLIGSSPLLFIAVWVWQQHRYRRTLLANKQ